MFEFILNLIYPNTCGFCEKVSKDCLCKRCEIKIEKFQINSIRKASSIYYDEICSVFKYEDIIRDLILRYKFQNKAYLYKTISSVILKNKKICGFLKKYDIIIPVPVHKKRKNQRGYNQTELIAKEISKRLNIGLGKNILLKKINTRPQSELSKRERRNNIKNVFSVSNSYKIINKMVLILDDIYTTGNTVSECAKILKESGAKAIGVLTIAKD